MKHQLKKILLAGVCMAVLCLAACNKTEGQEQSPTPTNAVAEQPTQAPVAESEPTVAEEAEPTATPKPTNTPTPTPTPFPTPLPEMVATSIKEQAKKFGFTFGTVINGTTVNDKNFKSMVESEFNSITAGNEMKAYSLFL